MTAARAWFAGLSPRERLLVAVAGGLLALLAFWLLVVRPIAAARASGLAAYAEAAETYAVVTRATGTPSARGPDYGDEPLRTVISESAEAWGVVIDRYDIGEATVDLTISDTDAGTLYPWLDELAGVHGVTVREGAVRAQNQSQNQNQGGGDAGRVTARLTLSR